MNAILGSTSSRIVFDRIKDVVFNTHGVKVTAVVTGEGDTNFSYKMSADIPSAKVVKIRAFVDGFIAASNY